MANQYTAETPWTPERCGLLASNWADGRSIRQIAKALHTSPGSISSKLGRLGLLGTREPKEKRQKRRVGPVRSLKHTRKAVRESLQPQPTLSISLRDLKFDQCHAVTDSTRWEQRFCGHPCAIGRSYCAGHQVLFYTSGKART